MSGPFTVSEATEIFGGFFHCSPVGLVEKIPGDGNWRMIRHLSKQDNDRNSTNNWLDSDDFPTTYFTSTWVAQFVGFLSLYYLPPPFPSCNRLHSICGLRPMCQWHTLPYSLCTLLICGVLSWCSLLLVYSPCVPNVYSALICGLSGPAGTLNCLESFFCPWLHLISPHKSYLSCCSPSPMTNPHIHGC